MLDVAARLFYARGVRSVGMDELVRETGLGKATVYRLFATKDALVEAYLERLAAEIFSAIDAQIEQSSDPESALLTVLDSIEADLARPGFRGCPFHNASIEYDDPQSPPRVIARRYRGQLHRRLRDLTASNDAADQLAVLIDGAYANAAHLGLSGPSASGLDMARHLASTASGSGPRKKEVQDSK